MTGHNIDQHLLSQIESIRQQLHIAASHPSADLPRCLVLTQRLDRLVVQLHSNQLDASSAQGILSEISGALPSLQPKEPNTNLSLLRETLPPQPRAQSDLQNQSRLIEHLMSQPAAGAAESAQRALLDYAQTLQQQPQPGHLNPIALQQRLSELMVSRAEKPTPHLHSHLVSSSDIPALQRAVAVPTSIQALNTPLPSAPSSGNINADLKELAERYLSTNPAAVNNEDLILAHIQTDPQGTIRHIDLHKVHRVASKAARPAQAADSAPQTPVFSASGHSPGHSPTPISAPMSAATLDEARRAILEQQQQLALTRGEATDAQAAFAKAQERLALSEAQANIDQQHAQHLSASQADQQAAQRIAAATHDAARQTLQQQGSQLAQLTRSLVQLLYKQAQQSDANREVFVNHARVIDQWLASSSDFQSADPAAIQRASASVQDFIRQILPSASGTITDQLTGLSSQVSVAQSQAMQASEPLSWSPLASLSQAPKEAPAASDETLRAVRSLAEDHAARFQASRYLAVEQEDRLLASERAFASITGESILRTTPKALLAVPAAPTFAAPAAAPASLTLAPVQAAASLHLQRLQGLTSAHAAPSVDLHSDTAGLDLAPSSSRAVLSGDNNIAALTSELLHRAIQHAFLRLSDANQDAVLFASSAGRLASTRSGQRDLGLSGASDKQSPLFKRKIGVSLDGKIGQVFLPALREVSGLSPASSLPTATARASERGELVSARAEAQALQDRQSLLLSSISRLMGGMAPNPESAALLRQSSSAASQTQTTLQRIERAVLSAEAGQQGQHTSDPNALERQELAKELRSEAQSVPTDVASKLSPVLSEIGVDIGGIRLYNGPRAARLAEAMGAHAFTMGKHVFGRMDLSTVEGLSTFAHEATHTTHFDAPTSVTQKEQEAEAVERKAVHSLTEGRFQLALDNPVPRKNDGVLRSAGARSLLEAAAPNANDITSAVSAMVDLSNAAVERVSEFIMKRMKREMAQDAERVGLRPG